MPDIKRHVLLSYNDDNFSFYPIASSDKQALVLSIRELENKLGKMHGSLRKYFVDKNNWEIRLI